MNRRVVVTGMGVISPIGNDIDTFWNNLINGVNGIGHITKFDTTDYAVKIAAEVKDFNVLDYMSKPDSRRADINVHYAMGAAAQAVEDSGIEGKFVPERCGVYFGSGIGGITTFEEVNTKLINKGPRFVSPQFQGLPRYRTHRLILWQQNFQPHLQSKELSRPFSLPP